MIPLTKAAVCCNCQPEIVVELVNQACPICGSHACIMLSAILNRPATNKLGDQNEADNQ